MGRDIGSVYGCRVAEETVTDVSIWKPVRWMADMKFQLKNLSAS